jgi:hypothetical protein
LTRTVCAIFLYVHFGSVESNSQRHNHFQSPLDLSGSVFLPHLRQPPYASTAHFSPGGVFTAHVFTDSWVLTTMRAQQEQCLQLLEKLNNGEGSLFKVTMSVNKLGRIDLYQWIYFIAQHAKRHIGQMQSNLDEWQDCG